MNTVYKECEHDNLTEDIQRKKQWLQMSSPAHQELCKIVLNDVLVKDLEKVCDQISTTLLEVFHSVKIRYLPKSIFYGYEKMIAGTQLAALDHNNNVGRDQVSIRKNGGILRPFMFLISQLHNFSVKLF